MPSKFGGASRVRTDDLMLAKQLLSQLSYSPKFLFIHHITQLARSIGVEPTFASITLLNVRSVGGYNRINHCVLGTKGQLYIEGFSYSESAL